MRLTRLNMHDAKTHLSRHLAGMKQDDRLVLCNRNRPVAEIRLLPKQQHRPRKFGVAKGDFRLHDAFFQPLPDDMLAVFELPGGSGAPG